MSEQSLQALNSQRREELWAARIKQCRESGLGVQAWRAEQGLSYHTYYKWQSKLSRKYTEAETGYYEISSAGNPGRAVASVHVGQELAKPVLDEFLAWGSTRAAAKKSKLGEALPFLHNNGMGLSEYLNDGRLEIGQPCP